MRGPYEGGYETDPSVDSYAQGRPSRKPGPPPRPNFHGISFPTKEAAVAWLRFAAERFLEDEQVIVAEEQQAPAPHKAYVIVTTGRLIVVKTRPDAPPATWIFNPKLITLRAANHGATSTLGLANGQQRIEVSQLHPQAAQRLEDVVRLMKVGRVMPPSEIPSRIAFDGVYPIEYYEAVMGPGRRREIQNLDFGRHRFTLEVHTGQRRGFFLIRHFLETPDGERELDEQIAPFRSHSSQITRERGPPFQIFALPATRESPTSLLARHGITQRQGEAIRERYVQQVTRPALETLVDALRAAGATEGPLPDQYAVIKGADSDYVHFNGRVYTFTKAGQAVHVKPIH